MSGRVDAGALFLESVFIFCIGFFPQDHKASSLRLLGGLLVALPVSMFILSAYMIMGEMRDLSVVTVTAGAVATPI